MVEETKEKLEEPGTGAFFQNLMQIPDNQKCANCNDKGSDQGSLNYGVFLCSECAGKMLELGDDCRPFGDESWDQAELIRFNYGGNKLFKDMMTFYQLDVISPDDRYKSKAAYYYRRRLAAFGKGEQFTEEAPTLFQGREIMPRLIEESALDKIKGAWGIGWGKTKEVGSGIKLKMDESGVTDKMKTAGSYTWDKTKAAGGYIADKTVEIKNNPKVQGAAGSTKSAAGKAGEAIKGAWANLFAKKDPPASQK